MAELTKSFCSNIYSEMEGIFSRGVDPGVDQDLVMEQVHICLSSCFHKIYRLLSLLLILLLFMTHLLKRSHQCVKSESELQIIEPYNAGCSVVIMFSGYHVLYDVTLESFSNRLQVNSN